MATPGPPRLLYVLATLAVGVSVIGFVRGTRDPGAPPAHAGATEAATAAQAAVPVYGAMGQTRRGPNAALHQGAFAALAGVLPAAGVPDDAAARRLAWRARRAYDGAPPTVPHAITQLDAPSCLACHESGAAIDGRIAPAMSHPTYPSCVQCHVPAVSHGGPPALAPAPAFTPPDSAFSGLGPAGPGTRAGPGAPPTTPHRIFMRERCESCHGPAGDAPIRTTHPWRQSCQQCHAPAAELQQTQPVLRRGPP